MSSAFLTTLQEEDRGYTSRLVHRDFLTLHCKNRFKRPFLQKRIDKLLAALAAEDEMSLDTSFIYNFLKWRKLSGYPGVGPRNVYETLVNLVDYLDNYWRFQCDYSKYVLGCVQRDEQSGNLLYEKRCNLAFESATAEMNRASAAQKRMEINKKDKFFAIQVGLQCLLSDEY